MIETPSSHAHRTRHPRTPDARESATPLGFAVIGTGRVGSALAAALVRAGHRLAAVSSDPLPYAIASLAAPLPPDAAAAPAATAAVPADAAAAPGDAIVVTPDAVPPDLDLLLVAVPDDALAGVAARLCHAVRPGQVVAHTSGAHGLAVLAPVTAAGAVPLALHPAMTFTGTGRDLERLAAGVAFGVTAPPAARRLAERLVVDLGGTPQWIAEEHRTMYHAALSHGANHLVTLVNEAKDRLRDAGVYDPSAVLAPLLAAALDNALAHGDAALTGPVSRGDAGTVAAHLAEFSARAPESVPAYVALARRTIDRAITSGRLSGVGAAGVLEALGTRRAGRSRTARSLTSPNGAAP